MQWLTPTSKRLSLLACLLMAPLHAAFGWVLVYDLKFEAVGDSVNFRAYDGGYYLADRGTGTGGGTLILFRHTGAQKQYFKYEGFGEIFYAATNGQDRKAVLTATAANEVSTTTFFAIGDAKEKVEFTSVDAQGSIYVARELKGYAVSADSERDLPFAGDAEDPYDVGVAGATQLTCRFNETYTEDPKKAMSSLDTITDKMVEVLEKAGYVDGAQGQGSSTSGTGATSTTGATTGGTRPGNTTGASGGGGDGLGS